MVRKKVEQDNRTVSLTPNDSDIRKHLDKLTIPFATYVKELIRKDMNKSILDTEFKNSLKNDILYIVQEALNDMPGSKEAKIIKDLKQMLMQSDNETMYRSNEQIEENKIQNAFNGFKIVNTDEGIEVSKSKSTVVYEEIDEENKEKVKEEIDEDSSNKVKELFAMKNIDN